MNTRSLGPYGERKCREDSGARFIRCFPCVVTVGWMRRREASCVPSKAKILVGMSLQAEPMAMDLVAREKPGPILVVLDWKMGTWVPPGH